MLPCTGGTPAASTLDRKRIFVLFYLFFFCWVFLNTNITSLSPTELNGQMETERKAAKTQKGRKSHLLIIYAL